MKNIKFGLFFLGLTVAVGGAVATAGAQRRFEVRPFEHRDDLMVFTGGSQLGVRVSDSSSGVRIDDVGEGSPAEKAGLKEGDVVVQFDGERVRSARQFTRLVQETPEGRSVKMAILRGGQNQTLEATPENRSTFRWDPEDLPRRFDFRIPDPGFRFPVSRGRLGVTVQSLTPELEEYFGAKNGGVLVSSVTRDSPAAKAGLKAGDVITSINGDRVADSGDLVRELNDATSDEMTIAVLRDRKAMTLKATITRRSTGV